MQTHTDRRRRVFDITAHLENVNIELKGVSVDVLQQIEFHFGVVAINRTPVFLEHLPRRLRLALLLLPFVFVLLLLLFDVSMTFDSRLGGVR